MTLEISLYSVEAAKIAEQLKEYGEGLRINTQAFLYKDGLDYLNPFNGVKNNISVSGSYSFAVNEIQESLIARHDVFILDTLDKKSLYKLVSLVCGIQTNDTNMMIPKKYWKDKEAPTYKPIILYGDEWQPVLDAMNSLKPAVSQDLNAIIKIARSADDVGTILRGQRYSQNIKHHFEGGDLAKLHSEYPGLLEKIIKAENEKSLPTNYSVHETKENYKEILEDSAKRFTAAIYCSANPKMSKIYGEKSKDFAQKIAELGLNVASGGGASGIMNDIQIGASEGAKKGGGLTIGIQIPRLITMEGLPQNCDLVRLHDNIYDRFEDIFQISDCINVLPGGIGSLQELFGGISLIHDLNDKMATRETKFYNPKEIVLTNIDGYYDKFLPILEKMGVKICHGDDRFNVKAGETGYEYKINIAKDFDEAFELNKHFNQRFKDNIIKMHADGKETPNPIIEMFGIRNTASKVIAA